MTVYQAEADASAVSTGYQKLGDYDGNPMRSKKNNE